MASGECKNCGIDNEKAKELKKILETLKDNRSNLMQVLEKAQDIYGYLPLEAQKIISDEMNIPMAQIYGVVTFYSRFSLEPKGEYNIAVCLGTACYVKGSGDVLEKFKEKLGIDVGQSTEDGKFSLEATRCVGACGLAPVLSVNGEIYGKVTPDKVEEILEKYN